MRKLEEGLYLYKGVEVTKDLNGNYVANRVYVNDLTLPMVIVGATQQSFKDNFNMMVRANGGLKK